MAIVTLFVDVFSPVLQSDSEVMLYEMLVGSRPFRGTNNIFVLYCRFGKQWAVFKTLLVGDLFGDYTTQCIGSRS